MTSLGCLPIQQKGKQSYVEQFIKHMDNADKMLLVIAPEGTRKKNDNWRTSFLHLAYATNATVVAAGLDIGNKTVHLGKKFELSGDIEKDIYTVKCYFQQFVGYRPQNHSDKV